MRRTNHGYESVRKGQAVFGIALAAALIGSLLPTTASAAEQPAPEPTPTIVQTPEATQTPAPVDAPEATPSPTPSAVPTPDPTPTEVQMSHDVSSADPYRNRSGPRGRDDVRQHIGAHTFIVRYGGGTGFVSAQVHETPRQHRIIDTAFRVVQVTDTHHRSFSTTPDHCAV